jgi:hypothetical protein
LHRHLATGGICVLGIKPVSGAFDLLGGWAVPADACSETASLAVRRSHVFAWADGSLFVREEHLFSSSRGAGGECAI